MLWLGPRFFWVCRAVLTVYRPVSSSLKKPAWPGFLIADPTTSFVIVADAGCSAPPPCDMLLLRSSRSLRISALSYSKSVMMPIFFDFAAISSCCFRIAARPPKRGW